VEVCWDGLRTWSDAGVRVLTSLGWYGERMRRTVVHRVARHGLVLAVATVWTVAVGTRVEDAAWLGRDPARVHRAVTPPPEGRRTVRVVARGVARRQLWPTPLPTSSAVLTIHAPPALPV
jgi:hypothetical protein